jgi:uncharacterized protein YtpQ (UPF0354 family)
MARLLVWFGVLLCVAAAEAQDLSRRSFTEKVAAALSARLAPRIVAVAGDLAITIKAPDGGETSLSLVNLYGDYARDPSKLNAIVEVYVAGLASQVPKRLEPTRIVPVMKDRQWFEETQRQLAERGGKLQLRHDEFAADLVIVYAEDTASRTRYLLSDEDIGVPPAELRRLAVDNLARILPKIEMRRHDDTFAMITAGADYGASLLLFDDIWSGGQIKFDGDIVVAAPAKDVVLVTGSQNHDGVAAVRKIAAGIAGQNRYRLTETLFVYRDGRFMKFEQK